MVWSSWSRFGWVLAVAGLLAAMAMPAASRQPRAYGKQLVAQYQLPASKIARYAALAAGMAGHSARGNSMFADDLPWVGPAQRAGVGSNPYTLVLTVSGVAKTAGDIYAQWQAGWEVHETPATQREIVMAVPDIVRSGLVSGERVSLTAHTARVSFRGERQVAPMLGLVQMRNLAIDDIHVQVWSGNAPLVDSATDISPRALMVVAAACLLLCWELSRRRGARAAPPVAPRAELQEPAHTSPAGRTATVAHDQAMIACLAPRSPDRGHKAQVVEALHQVLTVGLAVETVYDDARPRKKRARIKRRVA